MMDTAPFIRKLNQAAGYRKYRTRWVRHGKLKGFHVVEVIEDDRWQFCRHVYELPEFVREMAG